MSSSISSTSSVPPTWDDLAKQVKGPISLLDSEASWASFKLFNSASRPVKALIAAAASSLSSSSSSAASAISPSALATQAVFYPKSSQDVLLAVNFAHKYGIDISVKSGGYNPSAWSTSGRLILDLKELKSVVVHAPINPDGQGQISIAQKKAQLTSTTSYIGSNANTNGSASAHASGSGSGTRNGETAVKNGNSTVAGPNTSQSSNKRKHSLSPPPMEHVKHLAALADDTMGPTAMETNDFTSADSNTRNETNTNTNTNSTSSSRQSSSSSSSNGSATPPIQAILSQQAQERAAANGNGNRPANDGINGSSSTVDKGKRRMLDSDKERSGTAGPGKLHQHHHYIHANAYPPFNFVNADPVQEQAFHDNVAKSPDLRDVHLPNGNNNHKGNDVEGNDNDNGMKSGDDETDEGVSLPFIYHPGNKETLFPNPAPPGMIPFSQPSSSLTSSAMANLRAPEIGSSIMHSHATMFSDANAHPSSAGPNGSGLAQLQASGGQAGLSGTDASLDDTSFFGAADPASYNIVSFGAGTTARRLDEVSSTRDYVVPKGKDNDYSSNTSGTECFVPWACYPVGSAIFLTGGYGFVSRLYGLSMDLVTELELVLPPAPSSTTNGSASDSDGSAGQSAEGRIVRLKADYATDPALSDEEKREQEELWWACRGAGTAFGIATNITCKAYNIGLVLAGNVIFPFNPITTPSLMKHWRDCLKMAPRELYTNLTLTAGPSERGHVVVLQFSWCGRKIADGETILQTMLAWEGERCLLKDVEVRPFRLQQENVSQILSSRENTRWLVRSTLLKSLSDASIHKSVEIFRKCPPGSSWLFETAGAAIAEPKYPSCFPIEHRKAHFQVAALHQWTNEADDELQKNIAESWVYDCLREESCGAFPCFLSSGEGSERIEAVYGKANLDRLRTLKRKYDPYNLFKHNHFEGTFNVTSNR